MAKDKKKPPKAVKEAISKRANPIWKIDKDNLDAECVLHPKLVAEYAEQIPTAKEMLDHAEAKLKVVYAEMDARIREKPHKYNLEKVTEAALKIMVPNTDEYRAAEQHVRDCKKHLDMLTASMEVLRARKFSLEGLIQLHGMNYFASVK